MSRKRVLSVETYVDGVRSGDRAILARAMTLMESSHPDHRALAEEVLTHLLPFTGKAYRLGISGAPGVGKSTFVERFGLDLLAAGRRVAVLAVDPSSAVSGGSVLGDKTRMTRLSQEPNAFIRPTPSGSKLGGVSSHTREMLLVAEAAGYDVVMVETVGVGQSELAAAAMVDFFLVLMAPAGGDDLQGIKRGILELADAIAVNKADGDLIARARQAQAGYAAALKILAPRDRGWTPQALSVSALSGLGLPELWALIEEQRRTLVEAGIFEERRKEQLRSWMWSLVEDELWGAFRRDPEVQAKLQETEAAVTSARMTPSAAARALVGPFIGEDPGTGSASPGPSHSGRPPRR